MKVDILDLIDKTKKNVRVENFFPTPIWLARSRLKDEGGHRHLHGRGNRGRADHDVRSASADREVRQNVVLARRSRVVCPLHTTINHSIHGAGRPAGSGRSARLRQHVEVGGVGHDGKQGSVGGRASPCHRLQGGTCEGHGAVRARSHGASHEARGSSVVRRREGRRTKRSSSEGKRRQGRVGNRQSRLWGAWLGVVIEHQRRIVEQGKNVIQTPGSRVNCKIHVCFPL